MRHDCQGPDLVPKKYNQTFVVRFECPACGAWFYPLFFLDRARGQFHWFAARPNEAVKQVALTGDVRETLEHAGRVAMPVYESILWVRSDRVNQ